MTKACETKRVEIRSHAAEPKVVRPNHKIKAAKFAETEHDQTKEDVAELFFLFWFVRVAASFFAAASLVAGSFSQIHKATVKVETQVIFFSVQEIGTAAPHRACGQRAKTRVRCHPRSSFSRFITSDPTPWHECTANT